MQLVKVDELFRERSSIEWSYDWSKKHPSDFLLSAMSESEKITILGLSSFHPNGYFREKAIKELSNFNAVGELSYLLIRANDWVSVVRKYSKISIMNRINHHNIKDIINNLPLIFRLKYCGRDEYDEIIQAVFKILSSKECIQELENGLNSKDSKVRLYCYEIMMQSRSVNNKTIINYLNKEKTPYIRLYVLRQIQDKINLDEFNYIYPFLLKDKFAPIRVIILEMVNKFNHPKCIEILEKALLDNNLSVRETSRYLLKKHDTYKFSDVYRNILVNCEEVYGAICGLGETGNPEDSKYLVKFIKSERIKIVKGTMYALSKLDFENYKEMFIDLLGDSRIGVSKEALRLLSEKIIAADGEKIHEIYLKSNIKHVKINALVLICSLSKWESIPYIIEICANIDKDISKIGMNQLEKWKINHNKNFQSPSKKQLERIKNSLRINAEAIENANLKYLEFIIKDYNF